MIGSIVKWALAGAVAGLLLGGADAVVILTRATEMFFDDSEMYRTALMSMGMCASAGAIIMTLLGAAIEGISALSRPGRILDGSWRTELACAAPLATAIDLVLWKLTEGPKASQIPARSLVVAIIAGAVGIVGSIIAIRAVLWSYGNFKRRLILAALCLISSAILHAIDSRVLVRLYPAFHLSLTAGALFLSAVSFRVLWNRRPGLRSLILTALVCLGAVVAGGFSLSQARGSQNPRFVITERTVAASDVLALARAIAPPRARQLLDEIDESPEESIEPTSLSGPALAMPGNPVILLTVDAMRFDRLAYPGAKRRPAPNLEKLASRSVVFERAYTAIPHTSYAISSLMTGKYVAPLFDVPGAPPVHETWPEIMHRFRYQTGGFFTKAVFFIDRARFEPYLRKGYGFNHIKMDYEIPAMERVKQTIEFLEDKKQEGARVFTWTHFFEPHEPYDEACTRFGPGDMDRYDCEIYKVDQAVGELLKYLDESYPNAIIIVSADHGEEFGDHGGKYHGTTLYDEQVRVPLIVRVPGVEHHVVKEPVSLVDLMGTVLSMLEIPVPARARSRDLSGLIVGQDSHPMTTFCQVHDKFMAVRTDYKLIWDEEKNLVRLYDLVADPGEIASVASVKPKIVADLKKRIRAWKRDHSRVELRPVHSREGAKSWPVEIQKALSGDESAIPGLVDVISKSSEPVVRRKAAELIARMWTGRPYEEIDALRSGDDQVVNAWLTIALHRAGKESAVADMAGIQPKLERMSAPWREVVLARLETGDRQVLDDVIELVGNNDAPIEDRSRGVKALASTSARGAHDTLISLIDNYQLALDIARALAAFGKRESVPILIKRMKRERFPERRAVFADALSTFRDRRGISPVAGELAREDPAPTALAALLRMKAASPRGKKIPVSETDAPVIAFAPAPKTPIQTTMPEVSRVVVQTDAEADGGSIVVSCNGEPVGRILVFSGEQEQHIDIEGCVIDDDGHLTIELNIEPEELDMKTTALALVGR